ncbi:MAG: nucleotidyltransferase family protein, partial [Paludibacteraceae bacterium]|nr:nucleotidyltransferase family protein [Paludibacteraceae bacterium]
MNAMIFAAGLGTRLKPLTDTMPKALVPIEGKPLLQILIEKLREEGFTRLVVNVHHFADQIIDFLHAHQNFGLQISISDERSGLLDTGGGLRKAAPLLFADGEPVLVHNVDILSNLDLKSLMMQHRPQDDATVVVSSRRTKRYFLFDTDMRLHGWTNIETGEVRPDDRELRLHKADMQLFAFAGIHIISPQLHQALMQYPDRFSITQFYWEQASE